MSMNSHLTPSDSQMFNTTNTANSKQQNMNKNNTITIFNTAGNDCDQEKVSISSAMGSDDPFGSAPFSLPPALREKAAASLRKTGGGKVYRNFNYLKGRHQ